MFLDKRVLRKTLHPLSVLKELGVQEKMQVADLGCGAAGHYIFPLADLVGEDGKVYAVDVQKKILEPLARQAQSENKEHIETIWSDLEKYGATAIEPASLDMALMLNVLYQIRDRLTALREAVRLLRVGGHLVAVDWLTAGAPMGPPVDQRVRHDWLEDAADKLGLRVLRRFRPSQHHFGIIFEK